MNDDMNATQAVAALAALAQETRLTVFRLLVEAGPAGLAAGEIGVQLGIPANTLSFHLKTLTQAGLLEFRQESRFIYYSANFTAMDELIAYLTDNCCQGGGPCLPKAAAVSTTAQRRAKLAPASPMPFNVLVLCTGNSARSVLGEMLFNHLGQGRIRAYSAGSRPAGQVNPVAIETLQKHGVPCEGARSKSWDEFAAPDAPQIDFIFTVCGNAAKETCPVWPGHPTTAHWGIPDPAHVEPIETRRAAFEAAYQSLHQRISAFLALPLETMSRNEVVVAARRIHEGG